MHYVQPWIEIVDRLVDENKGEGLGRATRVALPAS